MNKKYILTTLGVALLVLVGYVAKETIALRAEKNENKTMQVLTTFTVLADMAKNVAGDAANVSSITKPGAEIHGYEATPQDVVRMQNADLVLDNGLGLEKWAEKLYENVPGVPHVTLTKEVTPINITEGPYSNKPNPHAWMSPKVALKYVDAIADAMATYDKANAVVYKKNAAIYKDSIRTVDMELQKTLGKIPSDKRYLVSCEGAFAYLAKDYGLKELYLWPINADAQGTPQQIKKVIDTVEANDIPAIFCESTVSDKAMKQVASESGATFSGVFYVDSLSGSDGPTSTYLDLLRYNAKTLESAEQ